MKFGKFEELFKFAILDAGWSIRKLQSKTNLNYLARFLGRKKKREPFLFLSKLAKAIKFDFQKLLKMYEKPDEISDEEYTELVEALENLRKGGC